jgi:hypothetical protein
MKRLTRQQAINAFCKECIYDPACAGTWKQQTEACTSPECVLYPYRPTSKRAHTASEENPAGTVLEADTLDSE